MGFIREPKGVDFIISPSQTAKEDIVFISNYIQEHKVKVNATKKAVGFQQDQQPHTQCSSI